MSLSKTQQDFTKRVSQLINFASSQGFGLTFGDAYRDARVHGEFGSKSSYSAANSMHKKRLAVDFNLFIDGAYIADGSRSEWLLLGDEWERMDGRARWGGRFGDSNHFSFEFNGYK